MAKAHVDGAELWYELRGTGPHLVQIGGAVSAHEGYATVTDAMTEHFTVIDYDHRGYGQSDRPEQRYTMATWADDLEALLDAIGVERTHVHGGSMGGFIATLFAARYPDRVDRLVISGAVAKCDGMARTQFEVWKAIARAYGTDSDELAFELASKAFSRPFFDETFGPELVSQLREVVARNVEPEVFCDACDAMIEADVGAELARITAPTLLLCGSDDCLTPLDCGPDGIGMRRMAELIPGARLHVFEGCGHANLMERADESIRIVVDFLEGRT
jgi:pimeloyl-ACP methyl ester carboxylesterase